MVNPTRGGRSPDLSEIGFSMAWRAFREVAHALGERGYRRIWPFLLVEVHPHSEKAGYGKLVLVEFANFLRVPFRSG